MTTADESDGPGVVGHFERTLGPIQVGWSVDADGVEMPFQVVRFQGGVDADSIGYATLGLSRHTLSSTVSERVFRQELLMLAPQTLKPDYVVSLLLDVGSMMLAADRALLRGEVVGPRGPLIPESDVTALYAAMPVFFPDSFATHAGEDGDVVIVWLVPITSPEANFVAQHGWDTFEDKLTEQDPDVVDFGRSGMNL